MTVTKILAALAVAGAFIVAGCDDDKSSGDSSSRPAGNGADRAFAAEMIPHHESAIEMAKIAQKRAQSTFVKQLASDIITTQTQEIAILRREDEELKKAGVKVGSLGVPEHMMGMEGDVAMLKTAKPFDAAFLKMMITHHEGAIAMAKAELKKGQDPELKALAQNIIKTQQREIAQMRKQLADGASGSSGDAMNGEGHGGGHSG